MVLTPHERRGLMVIVGLLLLGTAYDACRALRPAWTRPPPASAPAPVAAPPDTTTLDAAAPPGTLGSPPGPPWSGRRDSESFGATDGPGGRMPRRVEAPLTPASIDLNVADATMLERLPGVGPVLAGRIVAHRRDHGPFEGVDDLRAVRGIGPRLLERLRPWVRVSPRAVER